MDIAKSVEGYNDTRKRLEQSWQLPSKLSDTLLKMATYLSYIGDTVGALKAEYEHERAKSYLRHLNDGKAISNAENLARTETAELRGSIAKLEQTLKNGQALVSIGQSRLRVLENEARSQA